MTVGVSAEQWAGRRVIVTGHTGFKGAWLCLWLERLGATVTGLGLEPEDSAGAFCALSPWARLDSKRVDLRDKRAVADAVASAEPEVVLHLGAQALVRRGYADPVATWATNVLGTAHVLEACRAVPSVRAVVVVTSDKVYENCGDGRLYRESDPLGGADPYSSSKAGAELVTAAWRKSFLDGAGVGVASARAGNVIGGGDRGEDRLLTDVWRSMEAGTPVRIRHPDATRPWQFVLEPILGYLLLAERLQADPGTAPPAVNFGPPVEDCLAVGVVVERIHSLLGCGTWELDQNPQPVEAQDLRLDANLASTALGWGPRLNLDVALEWTLAWWRAAAEGREMRPLALSQIEAYEASAPRR